MNKFFNKGLFRYKRRKSHTVNIGDSGIGGNNPIRIQSMTTTDTMDTKSTVDQTIRMVNSGCEFVRITAPSVGAAKNLSNIKNELRMQGYNVPLIADIHFTPKAAEISAEIVEKVRINPGNYSDTKKFKTIEYDDNTYNEEIERIYEKVSPLIKICKKNGTAMRIGTNHGSLSDRILSRFGDTPKGMVESALEYLRICEDHKFYNIVLSMKASNPLVMVHAYRLLVESLEDSDLKKYPIHLGVTEAGDGEDGRIKSAIGIGSLLDDGIGDTVRVSLTEEPEFESPVASLLVNRYKERDNHKKIFIPKEFSFSPFHYEKRESTEVLNIGGDFLPVVISDLSGIKKIEEKVINKLGIKYNNALSKFDIEDTSPDYIYIGKNEIQSNILQYNLILDYENWLVNKNVNSAYPLIEISSLGSIKEFSDNLNFIRVCTNEIELLKSSNLPNNAVLILHSKNDHFMPDMRSFFLSTSVSLPIIISKSYDFSYSDKLIVQSSTDLGGIFIQGMGDGIFLRSSKKSDINYNKLNSLSFKILQAARVRVTSTDFISCPSCGRTLFDLQKTTAMIREKTDHLKGLKIGIMGCIVNGPGEMADADYGYVGSGKDKITLYRGQEVVKRAINYEDGVNELIELIKDDGNWIDP